MENSEAPRSWRDRLHLENRYQTAKQNLWTIQQYNLQTFSQQPFAEISGSVGDMGTLLPILIALTKQGSISLSSTLVFGGLANILTGVVFGTPLPVQPMKAIAAVAIARSFKESEIMSAGLFVAGAIGLLSFTGLIRWLTNVIPIPVIKGIQVGTGLSLMISAGGLYEVIPENSWILFFAFLGLLASGTFKRVPYALIILLIGIIAVAVKAGNDGSWKGPAFSIWHPYVHVPSPPRFLTGMVDAGIGQLPLTTLNSIIAVSFLATDLLPDIEAPSTTALGLSVMTMNLIGCWFGSMPVCHGSGGLAAQYRFGARSGASIIFLGLVKLILGLFASNLAALVFEGFPKTLLCILLIAAGLELAKVGESLNTTGAQDLKELDRSNLGQDLRSQEGDKPLMDLSEEERKRRWVVCFMTVAGILAFRNDAVGFVAGILCHWSFGLQDRWEQRRSGGLRLENDLRDQDGAAGRHTIT